MFRTRIIIGHIWRNISHKLRFLAGDVSSFEGSTHRGLTTEQSLTYINQVFADYLAYAGLSPDQLAGKCVLEIGPGDNLGVALRFLAAGCSQVVCLDKFFAERDEVRQLAIYRALRESLTPVERQRFDQATPLGGLFRPYSGRLRYIYGIGIEHAERCLKGYQFDYIVSRAVLMEVSDSNAALSSMDRLLKPGGYLIHKVPPLQDYQLFRPHGYHPLEYLTVSRLLYRLMTSDKGGPNRKTVAYYRAKMADMGYEYRIHIVNFVGGGLKLPPGVVEAGPDIPGYTTALELVRKIRPRLSREFQTARDEDLIVEDTFLVARKPA
jgi:SAM-dependent methyltransferase